MYHQLTENGQMMHNAMCELLDRCKAPTKADDDDSFQIISLKVGLVSPATVPCAGNAYELRYRPQACKYGLKAQQRVAGKV